MTPAEAFYEITRGKPYELAEEERRRAGLTPETWSLEIVPDEPPWQPTMRKTCRREVVIALKVKGGHAPYLSWVADASKGE